MGHFDIWAENDVYSIVEDPSEPICFDVTSNDIGLFNASEIVIASNPTRVCISIKISERLLIQNDREVSHSFKTPTFAINQL